MGMFNILAGPIIDINQSIPKNNPIPLLVQICSHYIFTSHWSLKEEVMRDTTYQHYHVEHFGPLRFPFKEKHELDTRNLINHVPTPKTNFSVEQQATLK